MELLSPRVRNIFASLFAPGSQQMPTDMTGQPYSGVPYQTSGGLDPNLLSMLSPRNDAEDRLKSIMDTMPRREDYQPTKFQNIMGRLGGLSASGAAGQANGQLIGYKGMGKEGQNIIESNLNRPFNQAMLDWNAQVKPAGELADAERSTNTNARLTAATLMRDQNQDLEHERKVTADENKNQLERDKLDEKYYYASIIQDKLYQPDLIRFADANGFIYTLDKKSGEIKPMVNPDTGQKLKADKLPEAERLKLEQNNALAKIAAQGSNSIATAQTQGAEARKTVEARGEQQRTTDAAKPVKPTAGSKPKVGDQKVFPNKVIGRWDGQGWVPTGEVAK